MTAKEMIQILETAGEGDERLEEVGDAVSDLADDEKKVDPGVIEALFRIHERLHDPSQSLFNALESCVMGPQEKTVRKLARESASRKVNDCNIQLVGGGAESIKVLKEILKKQKLDAGLRDQVKEIIEEAEDN